MGVLYHRRSPMDHLQELLGCLRPGGQLVLETLVIEGGPGQVLVPEGRYARMGNVWFLPSCDTLLGWLRKVGLQDPQVVDETVTTTGEQRSTEWMRFHSLADFLDPDDPGRSLEGYPAPRRAVVTARAG
jgi:tRNA (mo5U34)-methyltransferase